MLTQAEWERNVDRSLTANGLVSGLGSAAYFRAIKSALRVARDFNKTYYINWSDKEQRFTISDKMPVGNFDVVYPDGHIIH